MAKKKRKMGRIREIKVDIDGKKEKIRIYIDTLGKTSKLARIWGLKLQKAKTLTRKSKKRTRKKK